MQVCCVSASEHVWVRAVGLSGEGGGGYQPGVYVPLKALFLVVYTIKYVESKPLHDLKLLNCTNH